MLLSGFALPVDYLSATSLSKAAACPEAWRQRYLLKHRDKVYPEMFLGSVVHSVAEENMLQKLGTGDDLDLGWLHARYDLMWQNQLEKETPEWADRSPDDTYETGWKMVEAYHRVCAPKVIPVRVEERFEQAVPGVPVPIVGYMDVVTADRIVDQKTSKVKVAKAKPGWRFQARVYQLVADLPTEWHVVTAQAEPKVYTGETEPGLFLERGNPDAIVALIQQIAQRLNDMYQRYGPDNPWPTEGLFHPWLCDRCHAKSNGCPAWTIGMPTNA